MSYTENTGGRMLYGGADNRGLYGGASGRALFSGRYCSGYSGDVKIKAIQQYFYNATDNFASGLSQATATHDAAAWGTPGGIYYYFNRHAFQSYSTQYRIRLYSTRVRMYLINPPSGYRDLSGEHLSWVTFDLYAHSDVFDPDYSTWDPYIRARIGDEPQTISDLHSLGASCAYPSGNPGWTTIALNVDSTVDNDLYIWFTSALPTRISFDDEIIIKSLPSFGSASNFRMFF